MSKIFEKLLERIPSYQKRMTRISVDIGAQVFEYMKAEGINQRQLAEKLGKKESEISKWLNGSHNFTIETIAKIEDVFDKDIVLVPKFATQDLGFSYEMKIITESGNVDHQSKHVWGFGVISLNDSSEINSYSSEPITTQTLYGKTS